MEWNIIPLIQMSNYYKYQDTFWSTFFQELYHILHHGKKTPFLEFDNISQETKEETEANNFARNFLINEEQF